MEDTKITLDTNADNDDELKTSYRDVYFRIRYVPDPPYFKIKFVKQIPHNEGDEK